MRQARVCLQVIACVVVASVAAQAQVGDEPVGQLPERPVSVPFVLDHNRITVEIELTRPDGSLRRARAWVDTGSDVLVLTEAVARELGIESRGDGQAPSDPSGSSSSPPAPPLGVDGFPLSVAGVGVHVTAGDTVRPGVVAEVQLPASVLRGTHAVFDYPRRTLTLARPGSIEPRGVAVRCLLNTATGLFLVAATIDGDSVALGVDTGSAGTWISDRRVGVWRQRHPGWNLVVGAAGSANFFGFEFETHGVLLRLPEVGVGPFRVVDVAVLGLPQELFDWYSRKSAGAVDGFLGGNVLQRFRLEVDFTSAMTYWSQGAVGAEPDLDVVGLTLRPEPDGTYAVAGVVQRAGTPVLTGVESGDRLLAIDGADTTGRSMGSVIAALRGRPGDVHTLLVERRGTRRTVLAEVLHLP